MVHWGERGSSCHNLTYSFPAKTFLWSPTGCLELLPLSLPLTHYYPTNILWCSFQRVRASGQFSAQLLAQCMPPGEKCRVRAPQMAKHPFQASLIHSRDRNSTSVAQRPEEHNGGFKLPISLFSWVKCCSTIAEDWRKSFLALIPHTFGVFQFTRSSTWRSQNRHQKLVDILKLRYWCLTASLLHWDHQTQILRIPY